jgi:hypothetical protein
MRCYESAFVILNVLSFAIKITSSNICLYRVKPVKKVERICINFSFGLKYSAKIGKILAAHEQRLQQKYFKILDEALP